MESDFYYLSTDYYLQRFYKDILQKDDDVSTQII